MVATISFSVLAEYYLQREHSLYYLTGEAGIGIWYGEGAHLLGYYGEITPQQLRAAYEGLSSDGLTQFVQRQEGKHRQPAWDITFSVPKSVSVLWSILGVVQRRWLEDIVMRAVKRAVDYFDAEALITRRGKAGTHVEHAKGVYALCPHGTSRAQDPQLHVHCLAINLCVRNDGSTGTIRSRDLYCHKMAAGAVFRAELAYLLTKELGLSVSQDKWKFKVDGVSDSLCRELSKRRKVIEAIAKDEGWTSPRVLSQLAILTRDPKQPVSLSACLASWRQAAHKHGFTREVAEALLAAGEKRVTEQQAVEHQAIEIDAQVNQAVAESVKALSAFKSYFPERDLIRETATRAQAMGVSASQLIAAVKAGLSRFENRIQIEHSFYPHYSTRENIAAEKELLQRAEQARNSIDHLAWEDTVTRAIAKVERKLCRKFGVAITLTPDQEHSLRHITLEPGKLKLVQGYAGTGKTQMLEAAHWAWKESGYRVLGTAITGRAALGLEQATGIPSVTIETLLKRLRPDLSAKEFLELLAWKSADAIRANYYEGIRAGKWIRNPWKQALSEASDEVARRFAEAANGKRKTPECQLTPRTVLVLDEAAMVPTKTLLAIQQHCDAAGTKLVLVGDRLQLPAIEAGGPFWSLAERLGHASLTTIIRQRQEWMKEATSLLIRDEPQQALELYARNGALHLSRTQRGALEKLIADYGKLEASAFSQAIALTATNEEALRINRGIQTKRKAGKQLGIDWLTLPNGERVFARDRVMLTMNDYGLDVRNGLLGTVVKVHHTRGVAGPGSLTILLDDQRQHGFTLPGLRTVTIDLAKYPNIQLGYAATTHKTQSITVESSFVLLSDSMLSKERAFTQLTRASHQTMLYGAEARYGDSMQLLAEQISKKTAKDLAHDHTIKQQRQHVYDQSASF